MDNCIGFGGLLCLGIIVLGFGKFFVYWWFEGLNC